MDSFPPLLRALEERNEDLDYRWYVTAGTLDDDKGGGDFDFGGGSDGPRTITWTAPKRAHTGIIALVVSDGRGGMDWRTLAFEVP